jgi:hypothetical protein
MLAYKERREYKASKDLLAPQAQPVQLDHRAYRELQDRLAMMELLAHKVFRAT